MKNLLIIIGLILSTLSIDAQTIRFHEDFETLPLEVISSGSASWSRSNALQYSGTYSDSAFLTNAGDTAILTTNAIDISGYTNIRLSFDQICKIEIYDGGYLYVSTDNGSTWAPLVDSMYYGSGIFGAIGNKFSSTSYVSDWHTSDPNAIPTNNWWMHESFDLSVFAGNITQLKIKFVLADGNNIALPGNYGWLLDNIKLTVSNQELIPPMITLTNPILADSVQGNGPFTITAKIFDNSGIDTAKLVYTIAGVTDTVAMENFAGDYFRGLIPSQVLGTNICYKIIAKDASQNNNQSSSACKTFYNIEKQMIVNIGNGTSQGYKSPFYNGSTSDTKNRSSHISIVDASELEGYFGRIDVLSFYKANNTTYTSADGELNIYIKHTGSDNIPTDSASFFAEFSTATLVYSSTTENIPAAIGKIDYQLNAGNFVYDGSSNIMVLVEWYRPSSLPTSYIKFTYEYLSTKARSYYGTSFHSDQAYTSGNRPNMQFEFSRVPIDYDVALDSIINPQPIILSGNTPIKIRLSNQGDVLLTNATVDLEIDSIAQPTYIWNGNLQYGLITNDIEISNYNFSQGAHTVKAWVSNPNDSLDQQPLNDTISMSLYACNSILNGNYTVGGASADFNTLEDAMDALHNCGINGPTTIAINNGVYNYSFAFEENTPGVDSINTLTFTSSSNIASNVVINNASDINVAFNGSQYITFKELTFNNTSTGTANAFSLTNSASHITIENCIINMEIGNNNLVKAISMNGGIFIHNTISNNKIDGAYHAISIMQQSTSLPNHYLLIEDNTITNFSSTGIKVQRSRSNIIKNNYLSNHHSDQYSITVYGIYQYYCDNLFLSSNEIVINNSNSVTGIYLYKVNGMINNHSTIINNISIAYGASTSSSFRALYISASSYTDMYYNTLISYAGSSSSEALYISNSGKTELSIKNNIIAALGGNYALETANSLASINELDYNSYYTTGGIIAKLDGTAVAASGGIAAIKASTTKDTNSIVTNPMPYSETNGRSFAIALQNAATPIAGITNDIDGNTRNTSTPSIGAGEFIVSSFDCGVLSLLNPLSVDTQNRVTDMQVVVRNFGTSPITAMNINYSVNNGNPITYSWTGNIATTEYDTITIPSFTVPVLDYNIMVYTVLSGDINTFNDSLTADYYGLPLIEASATQLISPENGCDKSSSELVSIEIKNNGINDIENGLTASYKLLGNSNFITETVTDTIEAGASLIYTFAQTVDMSPSSIDTTYNFVFSVNHSSDPIGINDTTLASAISMAPLVIPTINDTTINYGDSVILTAISTNQVNWFGNDTTLNTLSLGHQYTTPMLFDTTNYWLESNAVITPSTAVIGTGVQQYGYWDPTLYGGGMGNGTHQILYTAAELTAAGLIAGEIESISFQTYNTFSAPQNGIEIKMAHTSVNNLSNMFETSTYTSVYNSTFVGVAGWNTHTLSTPFVWDGVSNIIVKVCAFGISYGPAPMYYTTSPFQSVTTISGAGVDCGSTSGLASNTRPNTKFKTTEAMGCKSPRIETTVNVPLPAFDGAVTKIVSPTTSCGISQATVVINIVNQGTDTLASGFTATYRVDNNAYITPEVISYSIAPTDTLVFAFSTLANLATGTNGTDYIITAKIINSHDTYSPNDSLASDLINSKYTPTNPIVTDQTISFAQSAILIGTSSDSLFWYSDSNKVNLLSYNNPYTTAPLFDTTSYWVAAQRHINDSIYQIGSGTIVTTANPTPYGTNKRGARNQFLIKASELTALGLIQGPITNIAFDVVVVKGNILENYTISIMSTEYSDLNQSQFDTNGVVVFGPVNYADAFGWNTHNFSSPFYWDGQSNIIIETCFKNSSNVAYVGVRSDTTTFVSSASTSGYSTFDCSDNNISTTESQRPNIRFSQEGFGKCSSDILSVKVNVMGTPTVDAGLIAFTSPIATASSASPSPVKILLSNYGLNTLTSATINWSEKGIMQSQYSWSGSITNGNSDTITIDPSHTFIGGTTQLKAWVTLANDTIAINDTINKSVKVSMSGTYTIGLNNADYTSFTDAVNDLNICGISGPVVFNVDSGNYIERINIENITGSSAINTITFQSTSGNNADVNLLSNTLQNTNYIVKITDMQYVIFKNMTLSANGSSYGVIFSLEGNVHDISISNNLLNSTSTTGYSSIASALYADGATLQNIYFNNNTVNAGYKAISIKHSVQSNISNIFIDSNEFVNFSSYGLYIKYCDSLYITNNTLISNTTSAVYGIYLYKIENGAELTNNIVSLNSTNSAYGIYTRMKGTSTNHSLVANNSISLSVATSSCIGIYLTTNEFTDMLYNSINIIGGTSTGVKALSVSSGNNLKVINNNIATQYGYSIYSNSASSFTQIDYNNLYVGPYSTKYAYWSGNTVADLASLKALDLSNNANALNVNPEYYAPNDLHSMQIELYNAGIPTTLVTTDIDGDIRSTTSPSIGADEFTPPAIDLSAKSILYPIDNSCDFASADSIVVLIKNFGMQDINFANTPATITVGIDGINPDTIIYTINTGTLLSGTTSSVTVTTNYDLSANGEYIIDAHTSIANDGNSINDNAAQESLISFNAISIFPFVENFETSKNLSFVPEQGTNSAVLVSSTAANNSLYGLHFKGGSYRAWLNPTNVSEAFTITSHISKIYSCNVDANNVSDLVLRFDLRQTAYNSYNITKTSWFRVILSDATGDHYLKNTLGDSVFQPLTSNIDPFINQVFSLIDYVGQNFSISFEAALKYEQNANYQVGDNVLIDNITIIEPVAIDLGLNRIIADNNYGEIGNSADVTIALENFGNDTLYNIPLAYYINGSSIVRDTIYSSLAPSTRDTFTFNQGFNLLAGAMTITAFGEYPGDNVSSNDTVATNYKGLITVIPNYNDNFEGADNWVSNGTFSQWELGTPSTSVINSAHSGANAWTIRLDNDYEPSSTEYLYSPYIIIPTYTDTASVDFWHIMRTVSNMAYGVLEYTLDGAIWSSIGYIGIPGSQNWYNKVLSGQHVWNKIDNSWVNSTIKLDPATFNTGNKVQFRFKFSSESNNTFEEGWAIDDFKIYFPSLQTDAGVAEIISPMDTVEIGASQNIIVKIKNFGTDTIFSTDVKYTIGSTVVTETFIGVIPHDSMAEFTFVQAYTADANTNNVCVTTILAGDMQSVNDNLCKTLVPKQAAHDAGVSSIYAPYGETTIGAATTVKVYITNYGSEPITVCDVQYTVSGINTISETFTGNIASGDSTEYIFTTTYASLTGNYTVCSRTQLANDADPNNDMNCVQLIGTGIENISGEQFVVLQNQPNPAINNTTVDYYLPKAGNITITLVNVLGKTITNEDFTLTQGKHQWNVDVRSLESGVYYYTLTFNKQSITYKMIIVK